MVNVEISAYNLNQEFKMQNIYFKIKKIIYSIWCLNFQLLIIYSFINF